MGLVFLNGMDVQKFGSNWTHCYTRWVDFVYFEIPEIQLKLEYANFADATLNTTHLIQNVSNHLMVCTDAGTSFVDYIEHTSEEFGSVGAYGIAVL